MTSNTPSNPSTLPAAPAATSMMSWPVDYNSYKLLGKVGQGAFASVWRAECSCRMHTNAQTFSTAMVNESNGNNGNANGGTENGKETAFSNETNKNNESGNVDNEDNATDTFSNKESSSNNNTNNSENHWKHTAGGNDFPSNDNTTNDPMKQFCAIKILDLEHVDTNFGDIRLEVQTMRLSSHPNILSIYTSFIQSSNLWLVMQLMDKGSSLHCLQSIRMKYHKYNTTTTIQQQQQQDFFTSNAEETKQQQQTVIQMEQHITYILHETLLGLKYIHENGQIHRDIKAGNILLDSFGNVRIADFGVSGWLIHGGSTRENTRTFVGTPCWMAPEVMEQIHGYDQKADIWSLGITALELAKGYAPYAKYPAMKVLLLTIQEDPPSLDTYLNDNDDDDDNFDFDDDSNGVNVGNSHAVIMNEEWSDSFRSMIKLCLQKKPNERPNCEEILNHDHFRHLNTDENVREQYKNRIKSEICDKIDNVGKTSQRVIGESKKKSSSMSKNPVLPPSDVPAGTTWVFEDGSQVSKCEKNDTAEHGDNKDFFDQFEQTTQGENFRHPSMPNTNEDAKMIGNTDTSASATDNNKDDLDAFMDEFERTTQGENVRRPI